MEMLQICGLRQSHSEHDTVHSIMLRLYLFMGAECGLDFNQLRDTLLYKIQKQNKEKYSQSHRIYILPGHLCETAEVSN